MRAPEHTAVEVDADAHDSLMQVIDEHHRRWHEAPSMRACGEEPCRDIAEGGMRLIDESRKSRWGRD